jgi:imidazoleglycerol phosphate dehydratase HisB
MNSDLLDVMLSQLYTFTHVSKELTVCSSTGRRVTVLPEVAGSKHIQTGITFLTHYTAEMVSFISVPSQFVLTPT